MTKLRRLKKPAGQRSDPKAVRPNVGVGAAYQKRLERLVSAMSADVSRMVLATYRRNRPEVAALAADASPAMELRKTMREVGRKWLKRYDEAAPRLANYFAQEVAAQAEGQLRSILKRSGFAVEFTLTPAANDAYQAVIGEQVGLIRSIAQQHLTEVEGLVMRSVQRGGDLGELAKELEARYGVTARRAALIAHDQNRKANATINRVRQQELGITEGKWMHSRGGKKPRKSHVAFSGKTFSLSTGAYIDGKWIFPGEEINCRCVWRPVLPIPR